VARIAPVELESRSKYQESSLTASLAGWLRRVRGTSPKYLVLNSRCLRYRLSDIQTWLNERAQDSTAENQGSM
ncbi:helix-turn-helix transcriptional regulator, partial [Azospirillum griseum]